MTKRILALLLALTMVFSVLPTGYALDRGPAPEAKPAVADAPADPDNPATPDAPAAIRPGDPVGTVYEGTCGDALSWSLDDATGVLTVTGTGDMYDYSIETPAPWYDQRGSITALSLPEGLSSIGAYAFCFCDMLQTAVVPDSVQTIGSYAFARCINLSSLTLPAGLTAISPYMLYNTYELKSVTVPPAVTEIGDYAFAANAVFSLERVIFRGPQPTTVGENVFENRGSEICIGYDPAHVDSWAPNGETTWRGWPLMPVLPGGVCGENLSWAIDESTMTLTITGTGPMYDFNGASPAPWAADASKFNTVIVGEGVTTLGALAFANCTNVSSFTLPDSLRSIGCHAFYKTNVHTLNLPASLQSFDLTDLQSHGKLTVINVASGGESPYFSHDGLLYRTAEGVTELLLCPRWHYSYQDAPVAIFDGVQEIAAGAFENCPNVSVLTFPASLQRIGSCAFKSSAIAYLTFEGDKPEVAADADIFNAAYPNRIYYYNAHISSWAPNGETSWLGFPIVNLNPSSGLCGDNISWSVDESTGVLTLTGTGAMYDHNDSDNPTPWHYMADQIIAVAVSEGITQFGSYAFADCVNAVSVQIPSTLKVVNYRAFYNCSALTELSFPASLSALNTEDLYTLSSLSSIQIAPGATCSAFTVDGVLYTTYYKNSYNDGTKLVFCPPARSGELEVYAQTDRVPGNAVYNCTALTGIVFPEALTTLDNYAVRGCTVLESVTFLGDKPSVSSGSSFFSGCTAFTTVYYTDAHAASWAPNGETMWNGKKLVNRDTMYDPVSGSCGTNVYYTWYPLEGRMEIWTDQSSTVTMSSFSGSSYQPWAEYRTEIKTLTVGELVSNVGNYAFYGCTGLKQINLSASVATIGSSAFYGCMGLETLRLNEGLQTVNGSAFYYCTALTELVLPSTLKTLNSSAFRSCTSLDRVKLPASLSYVGYYAFQDCANLSAAVFLGSKPSTFYSYVFKNCDSDFSIYYTSAYANVWAPNGETSWNGWPIALWLDPISGDCGDGVTFYFDPDTRTLTVSGSGAMADYASADETPWAEAAAWIEHVVVEDGVTAVGNCAFAGCESLLDVSLGAGLTRIGDFAFLGDAALTELTLPASVNAVNGSAFIRCSALDEFTVADGNTTYTAVDGVLFNTDGTELICWPAGKGSVQYAIPDGVLRVGDYAFAGAGDLQFVQFPETLSAVGSCAFAECADLNTVLFPAGSVSLGDYAFADCSALELVGFSGVLPAVVGNGAFRECSDELLFLAAVDHEFGWYAPDVTEWQGHTIIGWRVEEPLMGRCGDALVWGFDESTGLLTVSGLGAMWDQVPNEIYDVTENVTAVLLREGVTAIPDYAFNMLENLSAISLPATLEEIGVGAIHANPNLQTLTLAAGSQSFTLNGGALYSADGQTLILCLPAKTGTVTVPTGVRVIRESAFDSCAAVTELVLPDGLETLGDYAFYGCAALTKITPLGAPPTGAVGEDLFAECHEDLTVWITEDQEPLWDDDGDGAWQGVPLHVTEAELPLNPGAGQNLSWSFDSAKGILHISGTGAMFNFTDTNAPWFALKDAIKEVWIEEGVTAIGAKAFYKYPNLHTLRMPDSLTAVYAKACYGCAAMETVILPPCLDTIGDYAFAGCKGLDNFWYRNNIIFTGNPPANVGAKVFGTFTTGGEKLDFLYENFDAWRPYLGEGWHGYDVYYVDAQAGDHIYVGYYKLNTGSRQGVRFAGYGDMWDLDSPNGAYGYFWDGSFEEVHLTKGIKSIGDFSLCSVLRGDLESIVFPEGLERIGDYALFDGRFGLRSIYIPASVTEIGEGFTLQDWRLESITVDPANQAFKTADGVLYSMDGTRLLRCPVNRGGDFVIPEGVTTVDYGAFCGCDLDTVSLPASLTDAWKLYGYPDWWGTSWEWLNQSDYRLRCSAVTVDPANPRYTVVDNVLYDKAVTTALYCPTFTTGNVVLPDTVTSIGNAAFCDCQSITGIVLPDSLESVGVHAFAYCVNVPNMVMPAGVSHIPGYAFWGNSMDYTLFLGDRPTIDEGNGDMGTCYYLPAHAASWQEDKYALPWGSDLCGENVRWSYAGGTLSIFGEGDMEDFATHAGVPWYEYADQITKVVVGEGVTGVGTYAFAGLTKLTTAELPESLTRLGAYAFAGDTALKSVTLPENLETVGIRAFFQSGLTEITVPGSVTSLGESAFQYCPALKTATFTGAAPAQAGPAIFDDCAPGFCILWPAEYAASWRPNGDETEWNGWPLALNVENQCGVRMYWEFDSATATLTFYGEGEMYDYETASASRPAWYANYSSVQHVVLSEGITRVGNYAFYGFNKITDVSFPSTLQELGTGAFWNCSKLNNVVLPANLETLGSYAFYNCQGLTALSFNDKLKSIGSSCFQNCYYLAGELVLPEDLETLGSYAFSNCRSYTAISIPGSLKTVGEYAFSNCYGALSLSLGEGVERIGRSAFNYCYGFTELTLPASLRELGTSCFQACSGITSVTIPAGVTTVSTHVFSNCTNLSTAVILAPWESIPDSFFYYCSKLENLSFPETVTKLGVNTFGYCKLLTDFSLFSKVTEFGSQCFQGTGFASVTLPEGVTGIPTAAFAYNTDLVSVTFQGPVTSIGNEAFRGCTNLENFQLPDSLLTLGSSAFYGCKKLRSVTIPEGVTTLNSSTFYNCYGLESVTLPNSLSLIDQNAFCYCTALTEVSFGYGLQTINYGAFNRCSLLASATFRGPAPTLNSSSGCFDYAASGFTIYYYAAYANTWSPNGETTWGVNYPISMLGSAEPGPAECGDDLTWTWDADAKALTVTGSGPMYDYSPESPAPWACYAGAIQTVTLDEGVTSVGAYAFYACTALTTLNLPASLNAYGDYAFAWCVKLTSAQIPAASGSGAQCAPQCTASAPAAAHSVRHGADTFGTGAFTGCAALTSVTIPVGTAAIPANAFASCTKLKTVSIPETVTAIGDAAFRGAGLTFVTLPASVSDLGGSAFQGCASLAGARFLGTPPQDAGEAVFLNCSTSFKISFEPLDYYTWTEGGTETTWEGYALNLADANRCGPQLYWSFNESTGVLRLTGSGEAYAYDAEHPYPWAGFTDQITEIAFGDAVTEIPAGAFAGCTALTRVTIPAGITKIGSRAFAGCTALTEADFWGEPPAEVGSEVFSGCASDFRVCYLAELTDDWAPAGETAWHGWPLAELKHRVTFLNDDGTIIAELSVDRGTAPTPPAAPARAGWVFIGWDSGSFTFAPDAALSAAMSDKTYTAVYEKDLPDGFYLIRPDWVPEHVEAAERFTPNPNVEGEYLLNVTLTEGELITVARVEGRKITALYPEDFLPGYTVDADHAGSVTVCFRESFNEDWADFGGYVFISESIAPPVIHFADVPDGVWYADAVAWALENGVTVGTSESTFSPNNSCTRAQIVTFLWRAAGCPEPTLTESPFTDVAAGSYYYKSVLWAVENGITTGSSATSFSPRRSCTRAEIVTFLWRAAGSPAPETQSCLFRDVAQGVWYREAVLWAVENDVTTGTSANTFSPYRPCTRAQAVTFLWRADGMNE